MKKCRFDVYLFNIPAIYYCKGKHDPPGRGLSNTGKGLIVVDSIALLISLYYLPSLILEDLTVLAAFNFEDLFGTERVSPLERAGFRINYIPGVILN
jgi:hypothetical protein